jgi:hypothetical protein
MAVDTKKIKEEFPEPALADQPVPNLEKPLDVVEGGEKIRIIEAAAAADITARHATEDTDTAVINVADAHVLKDAPEANARVQERVEAAKNETSSALKTFENELKAITTPKGFVGENTGAIESVDAFATSSEQEPIDLRSQEQDKAVVASAAKEWVEKKAPEAPISAELPEPTKEDLDKAIDATLPNAQENHNKAAVDAITITSLKQEAQKQKAEVAPGPILNKDGTVNLRARNRRWIENMKKEAGEEIESEKSQPLPVEEIKPVVEEKKEEKKVEVPPAPEPVAEKPKVEEIPLAPIEEKKEEQIPLAPEKSPEPYEVAPAPVVEKTRAFKMPTHEQIVVALQAKRREAATKETVPPAPAAAHLEGVDEEKIIAAKYQEKGRKFEQAQKEWIKEEPKKEYEIKRGGFYDQLRKFSFLKDFADSRETITATKKVNKLSMRISSTEAEIKQLTHEANRSTDPKYKHKISERIRGLEEDAKWFNKEKETYERRRDAAAEGVRLEITRELPDKEREMGQIDGKIETYRQEINKFRETIQNLHKQAESLGQDSSEGTKRSYEAAEKKANDEIEIIKKDIAKLVVKKNALTLEITDIKASAGLFDRVKVENGPSQPAANSDTSGGGRLERASESASTSEEAKENDAESNENFKDLSAMMKSWNHIVSRENRVRGQIGDPMLPELEINKAQSDEILAEIAKKHEDVDEEHMSPELFKLFIQKYAEKNKDKGVVLDMTTNGQKEIVKTLLQVVGELKIEGVDADSDVYKIDKRKAKAAEAKKSTEVKPAKRIMRKKPDLSSIPLVDMPKDK